MPLKARRLRLCWALIIMGICVVEMWISVLRLPELPTPVFWQQSNERMVLIEQAEPPGEWRPRVVHWVNDHNTAPRGRAHDEKYLNTHTVKVSSQRKRTVSPLSNVSIRKQIKHWSFEKSYYRNCEYLSEWQTHSFPNCNSFHELPLLDLELLSLAGSWRSVWDYQGIVVKLLQYHRDFTFEAYEKHRVDALAMEKGTSSPHIVNSHGFCGQSVLTQRAEPVRPFIKQKNTTSLHKLNMAIQIAQGVADLHALNITHNDLNVANVVVQSSSSTIQLNDFNLGILLRRHRSNQTLCHVPVKHQNVLWRSPEEISNTSYVDAKQIDVYGLGNILFQILTTHQPWTHMEPVPLNVSELQVHKLAGHYPHVPQQYVHDGRSQILFAAVRACFRNTAAARPSPSVLVSTLRRFHNATHFLDPHVLVNLFSKVK